MTTTAIERLRAESCITIGELIKNSVDEIVARWETRTREEHPDANRLHREILIDNLPGFLKKLGESLAKAGQELEDPRSEAIEHGDQRWDNGWSITELVRDYQIMRMVLIDFLEEGLQRQLTTREMLVLNLTIDDAIAAAVAAFATAQTAPTNIADGSRSQALDLLLGVLGAVGHELRNSLAPLTNSLEILRLARSDEAQLEYVQQVMGRQLQMLNRLVGDLMDLARLARGKMSIVRDRVDLAAIVRACAEDRRGVIAAAGITLRVEVPTLSIWTFADETRLSQAIGNLIDNARKFTDVGGAVAVRLQIVDARKALISVHDTGAGIDPAFLPRIFEAYAQAEQPLGGSRGGLGLGLALVKGVVELHGGSVAAASNGPGTGATFTIELPLLDASASAVDVPGEQPHRQPRRVLIIEDNSDSAESLKMYLELQGHLVSVANSGPEGISKATSERPDVVVCDISLPEMDGYAVAAELRRSVSPPTLIIALSGCSPRPDPEAEADRVFDYYLLKPADPGRLADLLSAKTGTSG
jgi:signal transduction histidine kinase/ActR/RegA family two-component response regulator